MAQRFDLYQPGNSYLYHLDPRTKVLAVLAVFVVSVLFTNPLFLAPVFFTVIVALILGRVPTATATTSMVACPMP